MQFGHTVITTPVDNPVQYDPAWRSAVAAAMLDFPDARIEADYVHFKKDPWIQRQVQYLRTVRANRPLSKDQKLLRIASTWYQGNRPSDVKFKLEPLLLTPISFAIISLDIGGGEIDEDVFRAYERLFFNVRRDDGTMHPSCQLRTYFSLPDGHLGEGTPDEIVWRVIAANQGYDALVSMWLWSDAHGLGEHDSGYLLQELWRVAQARMFLDVYGKRISHFDLNMLMGRVTDHERMRRETGSQGTEGTETMKTLLHMLNLTKPHMISSAKTVDEGMKLSAAIEAKLLTDKRVSGTDVTDAGVEVGAAKLDKLIAGNFKKEGGEKA